MSHLTFAKTKTAAALLAVAGMAVPEQSALGGPLCDWLFGHHRAAYVPVAPAYPYAASYPVAAPQAYAASYPYAAAYPTAVAPTTYAAAYPTAVAPTAYAAAYPAAPAVPVTAARPSLLGGLFGHHGATGATALQMPAYSAAYPPATAGAIAAQPANDQGYGVFMPPPGTTFPVTPTPQTSFYGTGNVYPSAPAAVAPVTAYSPPVNTTPSTIQTYPGIPASRPGLLGGLSRFFGTGHHSSYYSAPVTYYRPVTTTDPSTGAAVVVQQPCTGYEQQLQRSPVTTLAPSTVAPAAAAPGAYCAPTGTAPAYNPYGAAPAGGSVAPATGYSGGTNAPAGYYAPPVSPNAAAPSTSPYIGSGVAPGYDNSAVPQPQLDATGRPLSATTPATSMPNEPSAAPAATWWPRSVERPASTDRPRSTAQPLTAPALQEPAAAPRTDIRPLPAPEYPYPRSAGSDARADQEYQPQAAPPSEAEGRVAQANHWGYKPIRWQADSDDSERSLRPAAEARELEAWTARAEIQPAANFEPAERDGRAIVRQPAAKPEQRPAAAPVILSPRLSGPSDMAAANHSGAAERYNGESLRTAAPSSHQPAAAAPQRVYDNSGWSSKPR